PALYDAGYSSPSRVYERSHLRLGMTPATYRRGAAGVPIAYTVVPCPLGQLLVAATERGICRIALGSGVTTLEAGLRAEFPAAELRRGGADSALGGSVEPTARSAAIAGASSASRLCLRESARTSDSGIVARLTTGP